MSTSDYSTHGRNAESLITHIAFVDEDTVVVGHCAGSLAFVTFGMTYNPFVLTIGTACKSLNQVYLHEIDILMDEYTL